MQANSGRKRPESGFSGRLLGSLEAEVMSHMWRLKRATVRQVVSAIKLRRDVAYTTVMTVMGHLVYKGLLSRESEGRRYRYTVLQSKEQFVLTKIKEMLEISAEEDAPSG